MIFGWKDGHLCRGSFGLPRVFLLGLAIDLGGGFFADLLLVGYPLLLSGNHIHPQILSLVLLLVDLLLNQVLVLRVVGVDNHDGLPPSPAALGISRLEHRGGDLGHVGRVVQVRTEVFAHLLDGGITPTLSPLCYGPDGSMFNVNADHVAVAVAVAMEADELVFVSNVPGILRDDTVLPHLSVADLERLIEEKVITGGMIPKSRSALHAVQAGVAAVRITNLEGLKTGTGTTITL